MFAKIIVDYYGTPTPVQQLASFNVPEPRMVMVSPYDKGSLAAVEKAIRDSDLGVNPTNDGSIIRCVFPELSEQRRRELVKVVRGKAEDARVSIRSVRRHAKDVAGQDEEGRRRRRGRRPPRGEGTRGADPPLRRQVDELLKHKESELLEV